MMHRPVVVYVAITLFCALCTRHCQVGAFTLAQCEQTVDCPCTGAANGTTGTLIPSDALTLTITCGWDANGVLNGATCQGGHCLCAPGWWNIDRNTNPNVYAECGKKVANASLPGGSNLDSPVNASGRYIWNEYMPQICACNAVNQYTELLVQGPSGTPTCTAGNNCFPGCTLFLGCFAADTGISDCQTLTIAPTCNANQLPGTPQASFSTHPAVAQDPAWADASQFGAAGVSCVTTASGVTLDSTPPFCFCKPGFCTQNCCPCNTATNVTCGGIGTCLLTGSCSCPTGFGGTYCCPIGNNGTACGPYGTCMPDGTCHCTRDFLGNACQLIDTRCPTDNPNFSCSGIGTCLQQPSFNSCLAILNYIDDPSIQLAQFTPAITDEGIWNLVVDLWLTFKFTDISQSTDRTFFTPYLTACQGKSNEAACVLSLWVSQYNNTDRSIDSNGLRRSVATYILDAFAAFHPELAGISGGFLATLVPLINATYLNPSQLFNGEAALLCYPQYINWQDMSLTATFPTYPQSACQCTTTTTGTVGATMLPAGPDCNSICPLGNNGVVCSGFFEGQFEGVCSPAPGANVCICDQRFAGNACQFDLIGECYPPFSPNVQACTASSHGNCYLTNPLAADQVYACNCSATWRGQYCQFTRCEITDDTTECNGNGVCVAPGFTCSCDISRFLGGCRPSTFPALTECTGAQLCLPIGSQCEQNGIAQCGVFTADSGSCGAGQGFWTSCSNHGTCTAHTSPALPTCVCDAGFSGDHCQFEDCIPGCNAHSTCDTDNGHCICETMWSSPGGCTNSSLACFCSQNLCVHGEPDVNGTSCDCDSGWTTDGSGHCTVVQCPFIIETNQGEIPCQPANTLCPDTNGLIPQNQQFSLDNGCCINTCPTCQLNTTTGVRTCVCINNIQYIQVGGICFSACHGQPSSIVGQTVVCDCSGLTLHGNQFVNSFCEIFTCLNGGSPDGHGGCVCTGSFTGQFCETPNCGNNGVSNANGTGCICFPPYIHSPPSSPLCDGNTCGPDGTVITVGPMEFQCSCASNTLIGPLSLSCISLNCSAPDQVATCALCQNGAVPYITANQFACNCSGTGYTGIECNILQCLHGGTVITINHVQSCNCSFPWSGSVCQTSLCLNGGQPAGSVCNCPSGFTGTRCQTVVSSSSTGAHSSSSSSSSTAHSSSTRSSSSASSSSSSSSSSSTASSTGHAHSSSSSTGRSSSSSSSGGGSENPSISSSSSSTGTDQLESSSSSTAEASNSTDNSTESSSSSTGLTQAPTASSGLTNAQLYGAIFGSIGGAIVIAGVLTIVAWQLGWGVFGNASAGAAAASAAGAANVGGRARINPEERFPLMGTRAYKVQ